MLLCMEIGKSRNWKSTFCELQHFLSAYGFLFELLFPWALSSEYKVTKLILQDGFNLM